jgi:ribosomal protein RSM22 (predicted rRNA methylase)
LTVDDAAAPAVPGSLGPTALGAAIGAALAGRSVDRAVVEELIEAYRSGALPPSALLGRPGAAAAYAVYRMPATAAAAGAALRGTAAALPGWAPATLLDFGAGTGATGWAAAAAFPGLAMTLLEPAPGALSTGRAVLRQAGLTPDWRMWTVGDAVDATADLATAGYVLGELTEAQQAELLAAMVAAAPAVLLVEPGTPAGHRRILAARAALLAAGWHVAAPCPHQLGCPLDGPGDWCHFAVRVQRSAAHRRAKGGDLAWEDEKYAYVAAVSTPAPARPPARIVRHPRQRKGLITLDLCTVDGAVTREPISKRHGETYKRARKAGWGDGLDWPPS